MVSIPVQSSYYHLTGNSLSQFLAALVTSQLERILQPIAPAPAPAKSQSRRANRSPFTDETFTAFLDGLEPDIRRIAYALNCTATPIDVQDMIQEARIAIWEASRRYDATKIVDEHSFTGFCMKRARGAILNYLTRSNKTPAISLESYLTVDTPNGIYHRELADTPREHRQTPRTERRRILAALYQLTERERLVVMAHFHIDNKQGLCFVRETIQARLKMSDSTYHETKRRAFKKLARLL